MRTLPDSAPGRPVPFLSVDALTAGYGTSPVISDVSLTVGRGEVVAVIGPNGAGKSTLLKAITGQLTTISGHVRVGERETTNVQSAELARAGVGYVPQVNDVFPDLTVAENLQMGGYLLKPAQQSKRIAEVLALFPQLVDLLSRTAMKLSGGERKQVAIGRALMLSPVLLLLDEPTASLSPKLANELLRDQVRRLADTGTAVLLVEQKAHAALQFSDWAYVMVSGTSRLSGAAQELLTREDFGTVYLGHGRGTDPARRAASGATGRSPGN